MGLDDKNLPTRSWQWQPIEPVLEAAQRLRDAGHRSWVVGGAVRDALQGRVARDWDLATTAPPAELAVLFAESVGRDLRLGVLHLAHGATEISVSSLREEADYADRRHPQWIAFVDDPSRDAVRRDFTVNAIYADPLRGELLDPCDGVADLQAGILRTVGEPTARLREDPLRLLRAVRFAASAELELEPATARAVATCAPELTAISAERTFDELTRMFVGRQRGRALRLLVDTGLAAIVLPEVVAMDGVPQPPEHHPEGDVLTHVCLVLDQVRPRDPVQAWSAVLHDVGKPQTFERAADRIRFSGHDTLSAEMAEVALRRLRAPGELRRRVVDVCAHHIRFATIRDMRPGRRQRWLRSPGFADHLEFHRADCAGSHGKMDLYEFAQRELAAMPPEPPPSPCNGADVLALGVPEGPLVGEVLALLREELDGLESPDRATALSRLQAIVSARVKGS